MLKGYVERRVSPRVPFHANLQIRFVKNGKELVWGTATDISAGGIQFFMPYQSGLAEPGELVELIFHLPQLGDTTAQGELRHIRYGVDADLKRIVFCGIKFLDLEPLTWDFILKACEATTLPTAEQTVPIVLKERTNVRIETLLLVNCVLGNGQAVTGLVEDIGFGGVRLRLPFFLPLDTVVTIASKDPDKPLVARGVCVWSHKIDPDERDFAAGICFTHLSPDEFKMVRALIFRLADSAGESGLKL